MSDCRASPEAAMSVNGMAILSGVRRFWEKEQFTDFTIKVEHRKFHVHKIVMASVSDYFAAMLTAGMVETQTEETTLTEGVSVDAMEKLLQFVYTDDMGLTKENVIDVLDAAMYLQILTAIEECKQFMVDNLDAENCFDILSVFVLYCFKDGIEDIKKYLKWNFQTVFNDCETNLISQDSLSFLIENWRESEWNMFLVVQNWVAADWENREQYFNDLITHIRYCLMTSEELEHIQGMILYKRASGQWTSLVDAAVKYHALPIYKKVLYDSEQTTIRGEPTVACFSSDLDHGISKFYALDNAMGWKGLEGLDSQTTLAPIISVIVVNNYLIICSFILVGYSWYIFNPRTMTWGNLGSPLVEKHHYAVAYFDGKLYVLGGHLMMETTKKSTEEYDFDSGKWASGVDMPIDVTRHSACVYQGAIYVTGGRETSQGPELSRMDRLDPSSQTWESKAPMLRPRSSHAMSVMKIQGKDTIFVFSEDRFEFYDPCCDKWSQCQFPLSQNLPSCLGYTEVMMTIGNTLYYLNCNEDFDSSIGLCLKMTFPEEKDEDEIYVETLENLPIRDDDNRYENVDPFCAALQFHHKYFDISKC